MKNPFNLLSLVLIPVFFAGCSQGTSIATPTSEFCDPVEITQFREIFLPLVKIYYDQVLVTESAEKSSVQAEMATLESIKGEVTNLAANACTRNLKTALIGAVESSVALFRSEFAGQPESTRQAYFETGTSFIREINLELAKLADCMPSCKP
jgi:hypothetical protein